MSKSCPACTSTHRVEIERRLKAKEGVRSISRWLSETFKETIAFSTIFRHSQVHMIQAEKFAEKVLENPKLRLALVPRSDIIPTDIALPPLEALAHVQNVSIDVTDALAERMKTSGVSSEEAALFRGVLREARQAAKHRHELVFGRKYHVTTEFKSKNPDLRERSTEDLKARVAELKRARGEKANV